MSELKYVNIDHVVLVVTDIERTLRFYVDQLQMSLERVIEGRLYQLRCGSSLIDLSVIAEGATLAEGPARGIGHLCLNIGGSMDQLLGSLADRGIEPVAPPSVKYGAGCYRSSVYVKDPDGYTLELRLDHATSPVTLTSDEFRKLFAK